MPQDSAEAKLRTLPAGNSCRLFLPRHPVSNSQRFSNLGRELTLGITDLVHKQQTAS